jgi:NADPH-ferrihemoprotein reductase
MSPPKSHILSKFVECVTDPKEKEHLQSLLGIKNRANYNSYIVESRRTILEILKEHPSVQVPVHHLLELLPRLQCRYYSISSSPKRHPDSIHITAMKLEYTTKTGRLAKGVCTDWMYSICRDLTSSVNRVPFFVRKSTFKLPKSLSVPTIMIGPGILKASG